ncbi:MAG: hypothetical protein KA473_05485 [Anaerolineales bacterium]|nr:hypothetical protein [Anaerolineales bacterium]MBP6208872.1 hypothetical protein [Anaerolineales bacterium]
MRLNTNKEVWIARIIAWALISALACGILFMSTMVLGPSLFVVPDLNDKVALAVFCPGAESSSKQEGASTPTTSSPSGTYGHTVEITCFYEDGSTRTIRNEQFALASIGGMFGIGGLIGVLISIPLFLLPFFLIRKKKEN